jgi:SAM-dependent methyltransferase
MTKVLKTKKSSSKVSLSSSIHERDIKAVQNQYASLPYPLRNLEDEKDRILMVIGEAFPEINHRLFKGSEDFKSGFRFLIAGGGTGDSSTFLAEQCRKIPNAEIVYLDFSKPSLEVARARLEARGLNNVTFICDSIFNIPKLDLGKFDFINCSGVLHHLDSPNDGLKILADSLSDRGGMHLMVYAKYGRTSVYHIQEIMRMINSEVSSIDNEILNVKTLMQALPNTNWFVRSQDLIQDHIHYGDVGYYDLFLHKQDRAYSIPELYDFVEQAGLRLVDFAVVDSRLKLKPESYIKDANLLALVNSKDLKTRQAICEIISGSLIKHDFFVSKSENTQASFDELDNIPYFYYNSASLLRDIYSQIKSNNVPPGCSVSFNLNLNFVGVNSTLTMPISSCTETILKKVIEGENTIGDICQALLREVSSSLEPNQLILEIERTLGRFVEAGIMFLRHKSVKPFIDYSMSNWKEQL